MMDLVHNSARINAYLLTRRDGKGLRRMGTMTSGLSRLRDTVC